MKKKKSKSQELKDALKEDLDKSNEFLSRAKDIADAVPIVQERKEEIETVLYGLYHMPEDVADEYAPQLMNLYSPSRDRFNSIIPVLPQIDHIYLSAVSSTGTASVYYSSLITSSEYDTEAEWVHPVLSVFDAFAKDKTTKSTLPSLIENLNPDLKSFYLAAVDSFEKSKSGFIGLDQAAMRMRDFIEKVWGELADLTRRRCANVIKDKRLELRKQSHRIEVAHCLTIIGEDKLLGLVFDELFNLSQDLSPIAKNPGFTDGQLLNKLHTKWVLQISELFTKVDL